MRETSTKKDIYLCQSQISDSNNGALMLVVSQIFHWPWPILRAVYAISQAFMMPWRNFMNSKLNWLIVPFAVNSYCAINDKKLKCARSHFPHNNPSVISKNPLHSKKRILSRAFWVTNTHFSDFYRKYVKHCVHCSMVGNNNKDSSCWLYWKGNKISYHSQKKIKLMIDQSVEKGTE